MEQLTIDGFDFGTTTDAMEEASKVYGLTSLAMFTYVASYVLHYIAGTNKDKFIEYAYLASLIEKKNKELQSRGYFDED